ncbi:hypothetical protein D1Q00_gp018 [Trichoplusia ni granulovirus LBIV-12]|uniref:Chitin-binding type-2 domain-containing protein n=2 Tax=Betabaculovirus TaxID=558017 RepID=A0A1D8QL43_GVTN|nr:hypothetical protein PsunGV_gp019 [Pseudalatia unipuncta granulovirus]YP_009506088.1 hypothetical protein D1Q00_gp018 [Trichoplusia ni granulovirus LBIV-12]ACH69369.1 unknown [Pseudalatia unipuncta granulovirus]AOW41357.1 hypothetical protein [Trichoplusia ni granulovirus LBIV-12]
MYNHVLLSIVVFIVFLCILPNYFANNYQQQKPCAPNKIGLFPDPQDCRAFYICPVNARLKCPQGFLYKISVRSCRPEDTVDCDNRPVR